MRNCTDFIIDLETIDTNTRNPSAIIQIGVVGINRANHTEVVSFNQTVNFSRGTGCPITLAWWAKTNPAYLEAIYNDPTAVDLPTALHKLSDFIRTYSTEESVKGVWGNGVTFDNEFLIHAYKYFGIDVPWTYRHDACLRTALNLLPNIKGLKHAAATHIKGSNPDKPNWFEHNAEFDALVEATLLQEVFAHLQDCKRCM